MKSHLFRIMFAASITFLMPFTLTKAFDPPHIAFVASEQAMIDPVSSVALGDVDGDGDLDAITIHPVQPGRVWLNDGTGFFDDSGQELIDGSSVYLGDLNGDGSLDVFISRGGSGNGLPSEVWLNDGTGIFSNSGQRVNNKVAMDAALDDVDNDGDPDIVIANFHDVSGAAIPNEVWLNDGSGRFSDSGQRLGRSVTDGVELGDLDDDGDIDLVFANTRGSNEIWLNQGGIQGGVSGIFAVSDQTLDTGGTLRLGDLDNDGDLDVLQLKSGHDTGKVWLNDGTGVFDDNGQILSDPNDAGAWGLALNDLDGDGDLDVFVAYGGGRGLGELLNTANVILVNDGSGIFHDSNLRLGNADSQDIALGDLDGDGDSDAFVANLGGSDAASKVWFNESHVPESSDLSFVDSRQQLGTINNWDVELVDLNDDGTLEAYFEGAIWQNDGQGNLTKSDLSFGPPDKQAWFADVNNDGLVDAICDNVVFLNRGLNQFAEGVTIPSDIPMLYAQLADLNDDGAIDIITAAASEDRILINDGLGNFTNTGKRLSGWGQCRYGVGDINGDGITDIYVSIPHTPPPDMGATSNLIWFGDGSGDFSEVRANTPVTESRTVVMADFDDDGDLDVFLVSGVTVSRVFVNNGEGQFTDSGQKINEGFHASDAQAGDLDNDGDLDLFITNGKPLDSGQPNTVWLNDGSGDFLDSGLRLGNLNSLNVALGDLNGDSYLDAIIANVDINSNAAPVEIWFSARETTAESETSGDNLSASDGIFPLLQGDYLGQTPPGSMAEPFAPAILSVSGQNHHTLSFSTDGNELYFTRLPDGITFVMRQVEGVWQPPERAPFFGYEAIFTPDGQSLLFGNGDLWISRRILAGWSTPEKLAGPVSTGADEFYASQTNDGFLYFTRVVGGRQVILRAQLSSSDNQAEELEPAINDDDAYHPFIAPDGSYLLFNSYTLPGGQGETDIYVSFRLQDGTFDTPVNLGPNVNSAESDLCPVLSPDGEYLFFTRLGMDSDGNWTGTPYWMSATVIQEARVH